MLAERPWKHVLTDVSCSLVTSDMDVHVGPGDFLIVRTTAYSVKEYRH